MTKLTTSDRELVQAAVMKAEYPDGPARFAFSECEVAEIIAAARAEGQAPERPMGELVAKMIDHHGLIADEISNDMGAFVQEGGGSPSPAQRELLKFHTDAVALLTALSPSPDQPTHHETMLAEALGGVLVKAGVLGAEHPGFTGPELIMAAEQFIALTAPGGKGEGDAS